MVWAIEIREVRDVNFFPSFMLFKWTAAVDARVINHDSASESNINFSKEIKCIGSQADRCSCARINRWSLCFKSLDMIAKWTAFRFIVHRYACYGDSVHALFRTRALIQN